MQTYSSYVGEVFYFSLFISYTDYMIIQGVSVNFEPIPLLIKNYNYHKLNITN